MYLTGSFFERKIFIAKVELNESSELIRPNSFQYSELENSEPFTLKFETEI
jgi:hypothetical protein